MKEEAKKTPRFPRISRFFTEEEWSWEKKKYLIYVFTIVFLLFIALMYFDLRQKITIADNLKTEKEKVLKEIAEWENVVSEYKDYRDGYLELARLEYRIGNIRKAKGYLDKVFEIDPNSKEGRELEEILLNNH